MLLPLVLRCLIIVIIRLRKSEKITLRSHRVITWYNVRYLRYIVFIILYAYQLPYNVRRELLYYISYWVYPYIYKITDFFYVLRFWRHFWTSLRFLLSYSKCFTKCPHGAHFAIFDLRRRKEGTYYVLFFHFFCETYEYNFTNFS